MKTKTYTLLLFTLLVSNSFSQTVNITSSSCGVHQFIFSFVDGTGRNFLGGITDALSWNASLNQWEWTDYGSSSPVTYYTNSYASSPNPPCLNTGTWVQTNATCGTILDITGDCQTSLTSINENVVSGSYSVFPNPASDKISIILNTGITKNMTITIFNSLGENIYEQAVSTHKTEINLSNQSNGIYFVQLHCNDGIFNRKIILSR